MSQTISPSKPRPSILFPRKINIGIPYFKYLSEYYCCSLTIDLVTLQLRWRGTMGLMLFSCLLTQYPFCSHGSRSNFTFQVYLF